MIFWPDSRGIFTICSIELPRGERIVSTPSNPPQGNIKHKKHVLQSFVDLSRCLFLFVVHNIYLDPRNILLNPTALPNRGADYTCNCLVCT